MVLRETEVGRLIDAMEIDYFAGQELLNWSYTPPRDN